MQARGTPVADALHRAAAASNSTAVPGIAPVAGSFQRFAGAGLLSPEVGVLLLADMRPASMLWGWSRLVLGPGALNAVRGLRFARVLGSGHRGRFGLRPSATLQGLFLLFDDEAAADDFLDVSAVASSYRAHAREWCSAKLRAYSSRGSWGGVKAETALSAPATGQVVALTRASIRPSKAVAFWRMAPPAQSSLERASGCRFAVGLGEAPLLRQATFSLWDSVAAMDAYARSGAHLAAIRASHREHYFSESMFVRFVPLSLKGSWRGQPLGVAGG